MYLVPLCNFDLKAYILQTTTQIFQKILQIVIQTNNDLQSNINIHIKMHGCIQKQVLYIMQH